MKSLEGLDEEERKLIRQVAESKGITLIEARKRHDEMQDQVAQAMDQSLDNWAAKRGISRSELESELAAEAEAEKRIVSFSQTMGLNVKGRWQLMKRGLAGQKLPLSASKGHEAVHGSSQEKEQRYKEYQEALEIKLRKNPNLSVTQARKLVAPEFETHYKTIERHTTDPRKN